MNEKYDLCDIDESYLHTVSMTELFDSAYQSKPPIIDGLLYRGTYLFAGSPKIGKSFLMAQLAYHVSTGTNLWGFDVRQGKVLYLALEDNYPRLQKRLYRVRNSRKRKPVLFGISSSARQWLGRAAGRLLTEAPRYFACDYRHLAEGQRSRRRELQLRQ